MKTNSISLTYDQLAYDELSPIEKSLVDKARSATYRSYAPYSHFRVGASILLEGDIIVNGCNQENVAFPSGLCAERTAAFYAHSEYPDRKFRMIAIAARGTDGEPLDYPIPPCGACRQSLLQYEMLAEANVGVLLVGRDFIYRLPSVHSLLPFAFTSL